MLKKFIGVLVLALLLVPPIFAGPFAWVCVAYDLTATSYTYCTSASTGAPTCGATVNDGWYNMPAMSVHNVVANIEWVTKAATSLDYSVECRTWGASTSTPPIVKQASLTATGTDAIVVMNSPMFDQCRIGLKLTTDTGTNLVTAYFSAR